MSEPRPQCKNTRYPHTVGHPSYAARYQGYCLECSNAGIDELQEEIDRLRDELRRLREALAESGIILEALELSVEWELAPAIKDTIRERNRRNRTLLPAKETT